jgi:uncharacterized protein (TIGR00375 family)
MKYFVDFHLHSRHSRATSKNLNIDNLEKYARIKGLNVLGTGDFQHPLWRKELDEKLVEDDKGILRTKNGFTFIYTTEISFMFSQGGKRRAIHLVVLAPSGKVVDEITKFLESRGRLDYDGRPIFGMSCIEFVREMKKIDEQIEIIPAHCMTPWFGVFGSDSGFDSLKECFGEEVKHIYAIESGMSADPEMLSRLNEKVNIVSFSDAHSFWPWRLGREATILELEELSYKNIIEAIRTGNGLIGTIETPPEYGKYHWDGHRKCNFSCDAKDSKKLNGKCPICGKDLVIGVENRVEKISTNVNNPVRDYYKMLPLSEILCLYLGVSMSSKKVSVVYDNLILKFENELNVLLNVTKEDFLKKEIDEKLVDLILINRKGKIEVQPGYDGEYGIALMPKK